MTLIKVFTPNRDFQYKSSHIPRKGDDISDGIRVHKVVEICHMVKGYDNDKELDYILVRAE